MDDTTWTTIVALVTFGLSVGVCFAIIAGSIKMGIRFAPWILLAAIIIWMTS